MDVLRVQEKLAEKYGYKPLPPDLSIKYRQWFQEQLPGDFQRHVERGQTCPIYSLKGVLFAIQYTRIVIGDYGAYLEIPGDQIVRPNIQVKPGQERRIFDPQFKYAKYHWYQPKGDETCKLYHQQRAVDYADYVPGMWYVSPYHVKTNWPDNQ